MLLIVLKVIFAHAIYLITIHMHTQTRIYGTAKFDYSDFVALIEANSVVPDNENEPFVFNSFMDINGRVPQASVFRVSFSTRRLLAISLKAKHICADATYKLTWQGKCYFIIFSRTSHT